MYLEESDMRIGFYVAALFFLFLSGAVNAQNDDSMDSFRARVRSEFGSFRENAYKVISYRLKISTEVIKQTVNEIQEMYIEYNFAKECKNGTVIDMSDAIYF